MQISLPNTDKDYNQSSASEKGHRRIREFMAKFNHDWMMISAAGLAYSLMVAVVPMGIAVVAILGLTLGNLNPAAQAELLNRIKNVFPSAISSQDILQPALTKLKTSAGFLSMLAVVFAIFGGSRLFIAIERCFDIVYRTYPRKIVPQYVMALTMMLVFIVLIPIMVFASSAPALILALLQSSAINQLPGVAQLARTGLVLSLASILGSLLVAWILFQAIYMVVPHQHISFKKSWKGALVAAFLLEIFLALFPLYITHFMSSYTGVVGFAVIFLLFFYYFAMILLLGSQVNAYFAENVAPLPDTLAIVLADAVGQRPEGSIAASQEGATTQYTPSSQSENALQSNAQGSPDTEKGSAMSEYTFSAPANNVTAERLQPHGLAKWGGILKKKSAPEGVQPTTQKEREPIGAIVPALVGTALAFGVTVANLRKQISEQKSTRTAKEKGRKTA